MKVIEKGSGQEGWSTRASCTGSGNGLGGCGAKLLVEQSDLYVTTSHARDETTTYATFRCCECGVETDIKGVPKNITGALPKRLAWRITKGLEKAQDGAQ